MTSCRNSENVKRSMSCFLVVHVSIIAFVSSTVATALPRNDPVLPQKEFPQTNSISRDFKPSGFSTRPHEPIKTDSNGKRFQKRFDYEDTYDWESDEKTLNYESEEAEETLFQKMARNWKTVALRFIFLFSVLIMLCFCCRCCCRLVCPFVCDACCTNCDQCMEWVAIYLKCGKDPAYKKFNKFAKAFGIQIDYETFQKIKKNYGFEGNLMDSKAQQKAAENY